MSRKKVANSYVEKEKEYIGSIEHGKLLIALIIIIISLVLMSLLALLFIFSRRKQFIPSKSV